MRCGWARGGRARDAGPIPVRARLSPLGPLFLAPAGAGYEGVFAGPQNWQDTGKGVENACSFRGTDPMRLKPTVLAAAFASLLVSVPALAALKPGTMAPAFTARATLAGKEFGYSLADALKKGPVVLYFYP